jgi:hypothetical protein
VYPTGLATEVSATAVANTAKVARARVQITW